MCRDPITSNRKSTRNPFDATELNGTHKAHNHPSGVAEPSRADEFLTQSLRSALALVDIRVLDHIVIAGSNAVSFAERGLL